MRTNLPRIRTRMFLVECEASSSHSATEINSGQTQPYSPSSDAYVEMCVSCEVDTPHARTELRIQNRTKSNSLYKTTYHTSVQNIEYECTQ